jgi:hypothetical protein
MNLKTDREEFNKRQVRLIEEISYNIRNRLEKMGLGTDQELVETLVFDISVILDGGREIELEGKRIKPVLMFADDNEGNRLVTAGSGSWMHEICGEVVGKMFEGK